jgi:hypothetical protein
MKCYILWIREVDLVHKVHRRQHHHHATELSHLCSLMRCRQRWDNRRKSQLEAETEVEKPTNKIDQAAITTLVDGLGGASVSQRQVEKRNVLMMTTLSHFRATPWEALQISPAAVALSTILTLSITRHACCFFVLLVRILLLIRLRLRAARTTDRSRVIAVL